MIQKKLISMFISGAIGAVFGLILYLICFGFSEEERDFGFFLLFGPLKVTMSRMLIPFIIAAGYAGYSIPKYMDEEGDEVREVARAHSLSANTITWISWVVVYYGSGLGNFGHFYGIVVPMIGYGIGLLLFPLTISYLSVLISMGLITKKER